MRWVTRNPPATLIDARRIATPPRIAATVAISPTAPDDAPDEAPERAAVLVAEKLGKRDVVLEVQSVGSGKAGAWRRRAAYGGPAPH